MVAGGSLTGAEGVAMTTRRSAGRRISASEPGFGTREAAERPAKQLLPAFARFLTGPTGTYQNPALPGFF